MPIEIIPPSRNLASFLNKPVYPISSYPYPSRPAGTLPKYDDEDFGCESKV